MPRRPWLAAAMLATGVLLVVSAQLAGAASDRRGGIFRVGTTGASVQIDPQLSYISTGWWLEYATAAKLYNYTPTGNARARGRVPVQGLERRDAVHVLHPEGIPVQRRHAGDGGELQVRDQPSSEQGSQVSGLSVHHRLQRGRHRGCGGRDCGSHDGCERRASPRQQVDRQSHAKQRRATDRPRDAVLPGYFHQASARSGSRRRAEPARPSLRRAVRVRPQRRQPADPAPTEPVLEARPGTRPLRGI